MKELIDEEIIEKIKENEVELVNVFREVIKFACLSLNVDLRCLDWFSYNPDIHLAKLIK